jgi:hypothetical protein
MNFLINLFKKAVKGDNFRAVDNPTKYNDVIAKLNASGANKNGTPAAKIQPGGLTNTNTR